MLGSFYCLDNDIILKLATCNLFEKTLESFNIQPHQITILDSFQYKFSKQITRKRGININDKNPLYNIEKSLEIAKILTTISENDKNIDINFYHRLLSYSKTNKDKNNLIDKGEAVLISHICYLNKQNNVNYLLTGDKRCLKALSCLELNDIIELMEGKIWCLEQLILKNIEKFGFEYVKKNIVPFNSCDTVLKVAFYNELVTEKNSIFTLKSYVKELRKETGNLLNSYPE